ncbi:MAG: M14-type cytosolic carboxypeptidase [Ignavibacteriaceae bacterium]|nr:M14-type cytosolic carboxypeptidase [Ignavibacteriaceae bacterium]
MIKELLPPVIHITKTFALFIILSCSLFSQIRFDANFESGNMKSVTTADSVNYVVTAYEDIGGRWFYFRISGVQNKFIKVKVSNSDVKRAVYSYDNKTFARFSASESPATSTFQKTYEKDTVYVAYYNPYTLSFLRERIKQWSASPYVKVDTLGFTLRNLPIHDLTITDSSFPDSLKYHVWIHARTHPSETPSSWHLDGFIESILADNDVIQFYREHIVFHCIPFTNPDGVYYGRSRTNYDGVDIESNWNKGDAQTTAEVKILKKRMTEINSHKVLSIFQNLHSQAVPYCTFWIHTASSTSDYFYRLENQFSNLNTSGNPYFTQEDYSYSNIQSYFPEGWLWNNWGNKVVALTYETPYDYYSTGKEVTNENLSYLGERFMYSISEFLQLSHPKWIILDNKNIASFWNASTAGTEFFGDNYFTTNAASQSGPAVFQTDVLQPGKYDVYAWWQSNANNAYDTKFSVEGGGKETSVIKSQKVDGGEWNYLSTVNLFNSGAVKISVDDVASGQVVADAFRIIYTGNPVYVADAYLPNEFQLYQNYPNPFNPSTTIQFKIEKQSAVLLQVYNSIGELVTTLVDQELSAGLHKVNFDAAANSVASGIYYYKLQAGNSTQTKGMIFLK